MDAVNTVTITIVYSIVFKSQPPLAALFSFSKLTCFFPGAITRLI